MDRTIQQHSALVEQSFRGKGQKDTVNFTRAEHEEYVSSFLAYCDNVNVIDFALKKGMKKGMQQGKENPQRDIAIKLLQAGVEIVMKEYKFDLKEYVTEFDDSLRKFYIKYEYCDRPI